MKVKPVITWKEPCVEHRYNSKTGEPYEHIIIIGMCGSYKAVEIIYNTHHDDSGWVTFFLPEGNPLRSDFTTIYKGEVDKVGWEGIKQRIIDRLDRAFLELDFVEVNKE
jgi:hypothetical protein